MPKAFKYAQPRLASNKSIECYKLFLSDAVFIQPPHSPDLNASDVYLWSAMKQLMAKYDPKPTNLQELKRHTSLAFSHVCAEQKPAMGRLVAEFARRLNVCIDQRGGHVEIE